MNVYFDARMIDHPGIGRYIKCLLPHMGKDSSLNLYLLGNRKKINKILGIETNVIDFDYPIYSIQEQIEFIKLKKVIKDNVLHVPHYNIPVMTRFNLVVTIHDIIHILYPEGAKTRFAHIYMKFMIKRALTSAKQVICVSNSTKDSIEKLFYAKFDNITIVHEGVDKIFSEISDLSYLKKIKERYKLPDKFILYVGSIRAHKNIEVLLDSFEKFSKKASDIRLVMVGRYSQPIDLNRRNVLYLGEVASDADLAGIYNQALCLLNLSLYEGFGLTILEAQACGLPVVCSDIPPHREVGGQGISIVKLSYIDQVYENLYNVIFNNDTRKMLISKGLENTKRFDWQSTAIDTIGVYRKIRDEGSDSSRVVNGYARRGKDPQCFLQNLP